MNKKITCKHCSEVFSNWGEFDRHLKAIHNRVRIFTCKICQEKCKGNDEFDKHLEFTHGTNHWSLNLAMKDARRKLEDIMDEE